MKRGVWREFRLAPFDLFDLLEMSIAHSGLDRRRTMVAVWVSPVEKSSMRQAVDDVDLRKHFLPDRVGNEASTRKLVGMERDVPAVGDDPSLGMIDEGRDYQGVEPLLRNICGPGIPAHQRICRRSLGRHAKCHIIRDIVLVDRRHDDHLVRRKLNTRF